MNYIFYKTAHSYYSYDSYNSQNLKSDFNSKQILNVVLIFYPYDAHNHTFYKNILFQFDNISLQFRHYIFDIGLPTFIHIQYFKLFFMFFVKTELYHIEGQNLIFFVETESVTIKAIFFVFICVVNGLESIWTNCTWILEIFLIARITFFRTYPDHQQLIFRLSIRININLPHGKLYPSLINRELESFLTNPLNTISSRKLISFIHFIHFNKNIINNISL